MNKLFYEVESDYLELKNKLLDKFNCDYGKNEEHITIKEFLDIGFNNSFIYLGVKENNIPIIKQFNLGYKESYNGGYYSEDFSLNEEQLKCKIGDIVNYDTDSMDYTIMFVSLENENDVKKFIDNEGKCK